MGMPARGMTSAIWTSRCQVPNADRQASSEDGSEGMTGIADRSRLTAGMLADGELGPSVLINATESQ